MPIIMPPRLSDEVIEKVLRCVVTPLGSDWEVWDPKLNSHHIVNRTCDCTGYSIRGTCSHLIALDMYRERQKGATPEQVREILQNL